MSIPEYDVEIAPGADLSADPGTWSWLRITGDVRTGRPITMARGRPDEGRESLPDPAKMTLTVNNRDGQYSTPSGLVRRNTPIRLRVGTDVLFPGFVPEWPTRWDRSGNDCWVPLVANGILRRLQQSTQPIRSAVEIAVASHAATAAFGAAAPALRGYWPMESRRELSATSGVFDHHPEPAFGATPPGTSYVGEAGPALGSTDVLGSRSLPTFPVNVGAIAAYDFGPFEDSLWRLDFIAHFTEGEPAAETAMLEIRVDGTVDRAFLTVDEANTLRITDNSNFAQAGVNIDLSLTPSTFTLVDGPFLVSISVNTATDGVTLAAAQALRGGTVETASANETAAAAVGEIIQHSIPPLFGVQGTRDIPIAYGHFAVSQATEVAGGLGVFYPARAAEADLDPWTDLGLAVLNGWDGEPAGLRMLRITVDNGLPFELVDNPGVQLENMAVTRLMGPEPAATMLNKIAECPEVDAGMLFERGFGFGYRRRADQIDLPPIFELHQGSLMRAPEPTDDDQQLWNQVRCEGRDGGAALVRDQVSIDAEGLYDRGTATRNVHDVVDLQNIARGLVRVGTVDQMRWPSLTVTLAGHPELVDGRLALLEGRVVTLGHQWDQLPGVTPTDLIVQGWTDTITQQSQWIVELNCVPAAPWQTGEDEDMTVVAFAERGTVDTVGGTATTIITLADVPLDVDFLYRFEAQTHVMYNAEADQGADVDLALVSISVAGFSPSAVAVSRRRPWTQFLVGSPVNGTILAAVRPAIAPPSTGDFDVTMAVQSVPPTGTAPDMRFGGTGPNASRLTVYRVGSSLA